MILVGGVSDRTLSIFKCTIKIQSYEGAIAVKDKLVSLLAN